MLGFYELILDYANEDQEIDLFKPKPSLHCRVVISC